nr:hypothetical protein [Sphingomonas sp. SORGH_AS_0950]
MRRHSPGIACCPHSGHAIELIPGNDRGTGDRDSIFHVRGDPIVVGSTIVIDAGIDLASQNAGNIAVGEPRTSEGPPRFVQLLYDPAPATPDIGPIEDLAYDRRFGFDDRQLSPFLLAVLPGDIGLVAKRHRTAIVKALPRILSAALPGEDCRVARLLLVHHRRDRPADPLATALAEILGDRPDLDACVVQLAHYVEEQTHVSGHTAEHEHQYQINRMIGRGSLLHQPLKFGALVGLAAEASVGKLLNDHNVMLGRVGENGTALGIDTLRCTALLVDRQPHIRESPGPAAGGFCQFSCPYLCSNSESNSPASASSTSMHSRRVTAGCPDEGGMSRQHRSSASTFATSRCS